MSDLYPFRSHPRRPDPNVLAKLPAATRLISLGKTTGYLFPVTCEFGNAYVLFAYHDGQMVQVKVVKPEVEGKYSPQEGHLYPDGRICMGNGIGMPTFEAAYAKAVVWCNGFSAFLSTGKFPFSVQNQ